MAGPGRIRSRAVNAAVQDYILGCDAFPQTAVALQSAVASVQVLLWRDILAQVQVGRRERRGSGF